MINLAGIGHVLLRVADEEASKRFYRDVLGFRVAEQDPEHGGVFMTLGDGFHTIDITQHPEPQAVRRPERGELGLVHIAFKVASYAALREAYAHLLQQAVAIQGAIDHVCQRSLYFTDPTATVSKSITRCRTRSPSSQRPRRRGRAAAALRQGRATSRMAQRGVARPRRDGQSRAPAPATRGRVTPDESF